MQINTIGFPTGLFGAGGAAPDAGIGFAQLLGVPANPAGAVAVAGAVPNMGLTPPLAANDTLAPAATLSMAQLLTTAAPLAPATAPVPAAVASPVAAPTVAMPEAQPVAVDPAAVVLPEGEAAVTAQAPGTPEVQVKPNQPRPAPGAKPEPSLDLLADPAAQAPVVEAPAGQPVEASKEPKPVKRGTKDVAEELPADPNVTADAAPVAAEIVAVAAAVQVPVRPELAVKPQPSPTRQIGDVNGAARKADAAHAEPATSQPTMNADKGDAAVSAIAGKAGDKNDNAPSDERGQAPAFTLRQDAHAAPVHTTGDTARTQAMPAVAAAEPVVAARPGHLGQQMGVEIARKVEAGEDTLRVRLSPDNLGKVEVTLSFDDGGKLHATVRAESQHALDMLRQDAPDLGRALDQAGIRADAQSFRFESRSDGSGAQAQQQHGQNNSGGKFAGTDETDTTEAVYREIRGNDQVDLLA